MKCFKGCNKKNLIFFQNIKNVKKPLYLSNFDEKFTKSSEPGDLSWAREDYDDLFFCNEILKRWWKENFEKKNVWPKKPQKTWFWKAKNGAKMTKSKNFWSKFFLVGIDSECFETYFVTEISKSKFFPV